MDMAIQSVVGVAMVPEAILEKLEPMIVIYPLPGKLSLSLVNLASPA